MKKLIIILLFLTSGLFGQDNPMFDSLDYYVRNKITNVHYYISTGYYSPPWKYLKNSFDKKTKTLRCDSMTFDDPDSYMAKAFKPAISQKFSLRDTIIKGTNGKYNDTIRYVFDNKKRLHKKLVTTAVGNTLTGNSPEPTGFIPHLTSITYIYSDAESKRLEKTITESPYFIEERNFYYDKKFLSVRTSKNSNKISQEITFETEVYDYYPDGKLKKETRRVVSNYCPGICEGAIEYKYDTD